MSPLMPTRGMSTSSRQGISLNESRLTPTPPSHGTLNNNKGWSASCLRPAPPLSPRLALGTIPNGSPLRINRKATVYKEDALILEVIEAYCSTGKSRSTVNSVTVSNNGQRTSEIERHVLEVVQILQAQIRNCDNHLAIISAQLKEEQAARSALQNIVKDYVIANSKEAEKIEWPILENNIMI
ncbi:putative Rho guanine nucleotide exchange factor [Trypoxylus dichotomus]